ncbi:hypothetical protein IFM53868_09388 [Aspergillus udagawae]|uniref:Uncharacterized protein n=1 Tax=Aspergillus udagawae TaxID=91492 RepID=A0ABQ1BBC5_9EURO|nr:hypothetical protein IFM53868_09388 [Aspergillus udagawae]GFG17017.1 hypothetical protein IFM5058_08255 [Aspergillus udagawae]
MFTYIPIIYCFFPETASRTLKLINFLFASKSPFGWDKEKEFAKLMAQFNAEIRKMETENGGYRGDEKRCKEFVEKV